MEKSSKKKNIIMLLVTVLLSVVLFVIYRFCLQFEFFQQVLFAYMLILTVLICVYIIYNRGFSRRGVTEDMLPDSWDAEKKAEFVRNGQERMRRSKWMLVLIIAFLFTFLADAVELFVFPLLSNWF